MTRERFQISQSQERFQISQSRDKFRSQHRDKSDVKLSLYRIDNVRQVRASRQMLKQIFDNCNTINKHDIFLSMQIPAKNTHLTDIPWAVWLSRLENAYIHAHFFQRAILTRKVGQTDLVFGVQ